MPSSTQPDVASLLAADDRRRAAMVAGDAGALDALLADGLGHVHANGRVDDKAAYLAAIRRHPDAYRRVDRDAAEATILGDVGWIVATQSVLIERDGRSTAMEARVLSIWLRRGGDWVLSAFQTTRINP